MNAVPAPLFSERFTAWVEDLREHEPDIVAVDGKTSRRSHARAQGRGPLHLVSAWASRQRLVPGQEAAPETSNEQEAVPLLPERLALTGALVTIDAMGAAAIAVLDRGADDLLALEANQSHLFEEAGLSFQHAAVSLPVHATVDADHGRIETRHRLVSTQVGDGNKNPATSATWQGLKWWARQGSNL